MLLRSSSVAAANPFDILPQEIGAAAKRKGGIRLTGNTVKALKDQLKTIRTRKAYISDSNITNLVSILDECDDICGRLEATAFGIILDMLLHARYSRQKERGIYLLTASLHRSNRKRSSPRAMEAKKATVGKEYLQSLMVCFTDANENARIRRWVGVLILQLLQGSNASRLAFEAGPEDNKRRLGTMVVGEQNEILRIVCGQLLKALMAWDIPKSDLWPVGTDPACYTGFPGLSQSEKHWNKAFQTYVDELFNNSAPSQDSGRIYFAQALTASPPELRISGCTINILVDSDVSICSQSSDVSFSECLDIPFQLISEVSIVDTILQGTIEIENPPVDLIVKLKAIKDVFCHRNALPVNVLEIRITVQDEDLANEIGQDLLQPRSCLKVSQSMETITITPLLDDYTPPQGSTIIDDFNDGLLEFLHDAHAVQLSYDDQEVRLSIEDETRQGNNLEQTNSTSIQEPGQPTEALMARVSSNGKNRNNEGGLSPVGEDVSIYALAPATLPYRQADNDTRISVGTGNDNLHNNQQGFGSPNRACPSEPAVQPPASERLPPCPSLDADNDELTEPPSSMVSQVAASRQRNKYTRIKPKPKPKLKPNPKPKSKPKPKERKPVLKPAIPKEESKKAKKYSLKPKTALTITTASASKPAPAPMASDLKVSASKSAPNASASGTSAHNIKLAPKLSPTLPVKVPQSVASNMSISNRPAVKDISNQLTCHPPRRNLELEQELPKQDGDAANYEFVGGEIQTAINLDLDPKRLSALEAGATRLRANRLSAALAAIDDIEQSDPSLGNLVGVGFEDPKMAGRVESSPSSLDQSSPIPNHEGLPLSEYRPPKATPVQLKSLDIPVVPRRSPRLALIYNSKDTAAPSVVTDKMPLLNDHMARKTPLVSFGANGPRNQGIDSFKKSLLLRTAETREAGKPDRPQLTQMNRPEQEGRRKRDRESTLVKEDNKRQQTSKFQKSKAMTPETKRVPQLAFPNVQDPVIPSYPPAPRHTAILGSQGSRVDEYGSPIGLRTGLQGHANYRAIVEKVLMDVQSTESNSEDEEDMFFRHKNSEELPGIVEFDQPIPLDLPAIPSGSSRFPLSSPRPIEEVVNRYIPHKTTNYCDVDSGNKGVLLQQEELADPFFEKSPEKERSNLIRRLQHGKQNQTHKPSSHLVPPSRRKRMLSLNEDPESTLVNVEDGIHMQEMSSLGDMASESSGRFQDQRQEISAVQADQTSLDKWRMALRPHQSGILEVLYQVSNDLLRYLINHEQAIEDVLTEYQTGGIKLMEQLESDHQDDKRRARQEVDKIMKTMKKEYTDSRKETLRCTKDMRTKPIRRIEREWIQEQDRMQKLVEEGIRECT